VLRIMFREYKKRSTLVLLSREDPGDVATKSFAALLLGRAGYGGLGELFLCQRTASTGETQWTFTQTWMLNHCALPNASSLSRDEGAYLDPEATGIPLRIVQNLLAFKKRIITICIRFESVPRPVVRCKSIPGVATDMQQETLVAHVIGLDALHRHLVVCGSHERSIHSSEYADMTQYMDIYCRNRLLRS
jgi:hypothetical protein